jgi:hypothetical protein
LPKQSPYFNGETASLPSGLAVTFSYKELLLGQKAS